ncbi:hypothetical protein LXL04_005364 [Taraxacum kok-saghyz]
MGKCTFLDDDEAKKYVYQDRGSLGHNGDNKEDKRVPNVVYEFEDDVVVQEDSSGKGYKGPSRKPRETMLGVKLSFYGNVGGYGKNSPGPHI